MAWSHESSVNHKLSLRPLYLFNQWNYLVILTIFVTILEKKTKNYVGQSEWAAGHKPGLFCEGRVRVLIQSH